MSALQVLSPLSAWLVMLSLGLGAATADRAAWRHELSLRYWAGVYLLPLLAVTACAWQGAISAAGALGFALCVLSGAGTSGVAWARARGASHARVTVRLAAGAVVALLTMPLAAGWAMGRATDVAALVLAVLLAAQWLPWQLGRWWKRHRPPAPRTEAWLARAASWSVVALIALVAWQSLPQLLASPRLAVVAIVVAVLLAVASAADATERLEAMGVVKNLTLVTLVLMQVAAPTDAMTALAAFGAVMYPAAWLAARMGRWVAPGAGVSSMEIKKG